MFLERLLVGSKHPTDARIVLAALCAYTSSAIPRL
jgi:hypothetical protein